MRVGIRNQTSLYLPSPSRHFAFIDADPGTKKAKTVVFAKRFEQF